MQLKFRKHYALWCLLRYTVRDFHLGAIKTICHSIHDSPNAITQVINAITHMLLCTRRAWPYVNSQIHFEQWPPHCDESAKIRKSKKQFWILQSAATDCVMPVYSPITAKCIKSWPFFRFCKANILLSILKSVPFQFGHSSSKTIKDTNFGQKGAKIKLQPYRWADGKADIKTDIAQKQNILLFRFAN